MAKPPQQTPFLAFLGLFQGRKIDLFANLRFFDKFRVFSLFGLKHTKIESFLVKNEVKKASEVKIRPFLISFIHFQYKLRVLGVNTQKVRILHNKATFLSFLGFFRAIFWEFGKSHFFLINFDPLFSFFFFILILSHFIFLFIYLFLFFCFFFLLHSIFFIFFPFFFLLLLYIYFYFYFFFIF